jgi:Holliday junction resolvase-like predicted endonuclease
MPVPIDMRLKLLELTSKGQALGVKDLPPFPKAQLDETLTALVEGRLVSFSDGFLRMNGPQRVMLAEQLIHGGVDPKKASRFLGWQEFEDFAEDILSENGFSTRKHLVFKSPLGRREIDILAWNDNFTLAVDCKHWVSGLSTGRMRDATRAQLERARALARRPELLRRLNISNLEGRSIMPLVLALGELKERLIDGVPIVSVSRLLSFLYGVSPIDPTVSRVPVLGMTSQTRLM